MDAFRYETGTVIQLGRSAPPVATPTVADLRVQFEPMMLCPNGFAETGAECASFWDPLMTRPDAATALAREVASAMTWLSLCNRTRTVNQRVSSYGLKHEAERWCRTQGHDDGGYISNGALLMAAYRLGFHVRRCSGRSPNAFINIGRRRPQGTGEAW